ncbi:hypothetical protein D9M70_536380 [compost metagenome]
MRGGIVPVEQDQLLALGTQQHPYASSVQRLVPLGERQVRGTGHGQPGLLQRSTELAQALFRLPGGQALLQQVVQQLGAQPQVALALHSQALQFDAEHGHHMVQQAVVQQAVALGDQDAVTLRGQRHDQHLAVIQPVTLDHRLVAGRIHPARWERLALCCRQPGKAG